MKTIQIKFNNELVILNNANRKIINFFKENYESEIRTVYSIPLTTDEIKELTTIKCNNIAYRAIFTNVFLENSQEKTNWFILLIAKKLKLNFSFR